MQLNENLPNSLICIHEELSLFSLTRRSRDLCNQYARTLCVLEDQSKTTNRPGQTTAEKGKILFFVLVFSPRIYTDVRKIYYLAVHVKTLPKNCFLAIKVAFEVVPFLCWFRNFNLPIIGTRTNLWPLVIFTILISRLSELLVVGLTCCHLDNENI